MSFQLLGVSHHTAPVEVREQLSVPESVLPAALERLLALPGIEEALILSTCNRVELLVEADEAGVDFCAFLGELHRRDFSAFAGQTYRRAGRDAIRHLFRVASSLDSLVVGEPQILGQLKHAYNLARQAGGVQGGLEALLSRAFAVAKRVRTETEVASQPVSVSYAAVDLARQIFGSLDGKTVLLIGAGEMGELAARYLLAQGARRLLIANRTLERAQRLAAKFQGEAFGLEELHTRGEQADIVISCTGSPQPLIRRADAAHFLSRRRFRPMLFLDIAVPRDIDPEVHRLDNAFVYNIDDLESVVSSNLAERQREALKAEAIVEAEVGRFLERLQTRSVVPTLEALQRHSEALRQQEWQRIRSRLGTLTAEQERAVEAFSRSLMQKWLHHPMVELKSAAAESERMLLLEWVHRLFGLHPDANGENKTGTSDE